MKLNDEAKKKLRDAWARNPERKKQAAEIIRRFRPSAEDYRKHGLRMRGAGNPAWKGGVTLKRRGGNYPDLRYVKCPEIFFLMARKDGYILEHRLVVARELERLLTRSEVVHHINHVPIDNRIENLMLFKNNRDHKLFEAGYPIQPLWRGDRLEGEVSDHPSCPGGHEGGSSSAACAA